MSLRDLTSIHQGTFTTTMLKPNSLHTGDRLLPEPNLHRPLPSPILHRLPPHTQQRQYLSKPRKASIRVFEAHVARSLNVVRDQQTGPGQNMRFQDAHLGSLLKRRSDVDSSIIQRRTKVFGSSPRMFLKELLNMIG